MVGHALTDRQTSYEHVDDDDYGPPTLHSIEAAKRAQARERAAFTKSTGILLARDGTVRRSSPDATLRADVSSHSIKAGQSAV
jgi:hypothetical protein